MTNWQIILISLAVVTIGVIHASPLTAEVPLPYDGGIALTSSKSAETENDLPEASSDLSDNSVVNEPGYESGGYDDEVGMDEEKRGKYGKMIRFGKRGRYNKMIRFGKRGRYNKMIRFGKRGRYNKMIRFGKRGRYNKMIRFGKRGNYNKMIRFGRGDMTSSGQRVPSMEEYPTEDGNEIQPIQDPTLVNQKRGKFGKMIRFGKR